MVYQETSGTSVENCTGAVEDICGADDGMKNSGMRTIQERIVFLRFADSFTDTIINPYFYGLIKRWWSNLFQVSLLTLTLVLMEVV